MGVIFILASGFSQVISNTASAVLIRPIALQAATELGIAPHPMMMVALGVVTGILTPIAGAPMLIVMNPGSYEFNDYAKIGFPLLIILFVVTMILVPFIWPLWNFGIVSRSETTSTGANPCRVQILHPYGLGGEKDGLPEFLTPDSLPISC